MNVRRACVVGHPVAHSRSPAIHKYWLAAHRIVGEYTREDVAPEKVDAFLAGFPTGGYVGANVTVPHKEAAFRAVASADAVAAALGAVNLLWVEEGTLRGANTDAYGFLANFDERLAGWEKRTKFAVVLGAGGAARAVVHGLIQRGVERVVLVNRTPVRAEVLAGRFSARVRPAGFAELPGALRDADLLINTTALGMTGGPPFDLDIAPLKAGAIVYDIVYVPLETSLLKAARSRSHPVVDGLGMLLHQAVPAFERFFGVRPQVTAGLREAVLTDLAAERGP